MVSAAGAGGGPPQDRTLFPLLGGDVLAGEVLLAGPLAIVVEYILAE
jgi:hypothetical protein